MSSIIIFMFMKNSVPLGLTKSAYVMLVAITSAN